MPCERPVKIIRASKKAAATPEEVSLLDVPVIPPVIRAVIGLALRDRQGLKHARHGVSLQYFLNG